METITTTGRDRSRTTDFYNENAERYAAATRHVDMSAIYDRFLPLVRTGGRILDAGSGSGRDTLAFLGRGFAVDAFDAAPELCVASTRLTGVNTQLLRFQDFRSAPAYDGIWACASLLHVPTDELQDVFGRLFTALEPGGVFYASFKHGNGERTAPDGRYFVDMNEQNLHRYLSAFPDIRIEEVWISEGEGSCSGKDEWINLIATKRGGRESA